MKARIKPGLARILALLTLLSATGVARAEGTFQVRFFSAEAPLTLLDAVSVAGHYRTALAGGASTTLDLSAEHHALTFGVQYSRPHHSVQLTGRRTEDSLAGRTDISLTGVYTYTPAVPAEGTALTYATALYTLSGSVTPTFGYSSQTFGSSFGVRFNRDLNLSTTATATAVALSVQQALLWSANFSSSLTYGRDGTSLYLVPGVSLQNSSALFNVAGGGSTRLSPNLTLTGNAFWSAGTVPTLNTALNYQTGPWQFSGTAAAGSTVSFGVATRYATQPNLTLGASAAYAFSTATPTYGADVSTQLGGLALAAGVTLSTPSISESTLTARASVSGQRKPWQGNLSVSYARTGEQQTGNASGTLSYDAAPFGAQVALGLNLNPTFSRPSVLTGQGEVTVNYAVSTQLDLNATLRYERSVATNADAHLRYGLGFRYRFDQENK
ncbi:hypothetical protein E7T09_08590 [Deinococcus sp. KSM4-11]|uniref:hypothetical protein n=1 Tax=Deinococcus sp. KSM4-11 TaxID=2568654 RepID=UPI0010A4DB84|nr:hypothetical protein [Deinococcus sp. KSM4-11]THF87202.1 hypothetical protein E7T09_08590 [Deinococcus sp. KSM4-11]